MSDSGGVERKQFGSQTQFILSCIGYAVGLGNIWRFPYLAYENGGGAFLIPYLCCSFIIGLPILYLELTLGQFSKAGPAVVHGRIRPLAQGIGWGMSIMSSLVSIYYNVIVAWVLMFLWSIITGQSYKWVTCDNPWNDNRCISSIENDKCRETLGPFAYFYNGTCQDGKNRTLYDIAMVSSQSATEQYYENQILHKTLTMDTLGGINWFLVLSLAIAWILTALALSKGVYLIGKLSYFTATVPYIIIAILFVRAVTLEGAKKGLDFYLLNPDFSKAFRGESWLKAATQVCYSLAIGFGGLLSLASYNPKHQPCLRDALIITCADGFMSIFGGTAVFSTLGFMATQNEKDIDGVIADGVGLAFVVYPEAMYQISFAPWLWAFLFFIMLFLLGISSQFGLAEVMCTAISDQFPKTRKHKGKIVIGVCAVLFCSGLIMTTKSGIFYFVLLNDYAASFALAVLILMEIGLIFYVYGVKNYIIDLRSMFGNPKNIITRIIGPTGYYFMFIWTVAAPVGISVLLVIMVKEQITKVPKYGDYQFPDWSKILGWLISVLPLTALPTFVVYNVIKFKRKGQSLKELFSVQPKWPSSWRFRDNGSNNSLNTVIDEKQSSTYQIKPSGILKAEKAWTTFPVEK